MMQENSVSAGVVQSTEDLDKDSHLRHRNYFQILDAQEIGPYPHQRPPIILSKTPSELRATPSLAEHTEYICTKLIGLLEEQFVDLIQ